MKIRNPKRRSKDSTVTATWYPYYAGFSGDFAEGILQGVNPSIDFCVLDPWNGSGTTTAQAANQGMNCVGIDINPAMVVVAKARALARTEYPSLASLAQCVIEATRFQHHEGDDALSTWFCARTVSSIRSIETTFSKLLVKSGTFEVEHLSGLASFFYVALFRTTRRLLSSKFSSNPTWLRRPRFASDRVSLTHKEVLDQFRTELNSMLPSAPFGLRCIAQSAPKLFVGNSEKLQLDDGTIDLVLSSPPYCTRIDYAVATAAELAVLGINDQDQSLRRAMLGASTVPKEVPPVDQRWGSTCATFLRQVQAHTSKASATYYYKNHVQYFSSLFNSISEMSRVMRPGGLSCLVVQDSYYKNLHNDLPKIASEMLEGCGFNAVCREDFSVTRTLAGVHPTTRNYRDQFAANESVLIHSRA